VFFTSWVDLGFEQAAKSWQMTRINGKGLKGIFMGLLALFFWNRN